MTRPPGETITELMERWRRENVAKSERLAAVRRGRDADMLDCPMRAENVRGLKDCECVARRLCWLCGKPFPKGMRRWCSGVCADLFWGNHGWSWARIRAMERDGRACVRCQGKHSLECNHIVPLVGSGYENGCIHHLDGLETLCHDCHVAETTRQIRERREVRTKLRIAELGFDPGLRPARPEQAETLSLWQAS
jgi:hypothetical protein